MTRARALKQVIRARAAKTGERYTTARRHVLNQLATIAPRAAAARRTARARPAIAPEAALKRGPRRRSRRQGAASLTRSRARRPVTASTTGLRCSIDSVASRRATARSARHLYDDHGVPGWYSQGITVAYERARGARALNQRMSGDYEVSVTRTVNGDTAPSRARSPTRDSRAKWLPAADAGAGRGPDRGAESEIVEGLRHPRPTAWAATATSGAPRPSSST